MKKDCWIRCRVTEAEKKSIEEWVKKNSELKIRGRKITESAIGRSLFRWLTKKDLLLESSATEEMRLVARELSGVAGNLNQLMRAYNEGLIVTKIDATDLINELYRTVRMVNKQHRQIINRIETGADDQLPKIIDIGGRDE